jgi:hypothetical protein
MCHVTASAIGVGAVRTYPRRKPHYDDEVQYVVQRTRSLVEVVVPFMDEHLPPSNKRDQYSRWRSELLHFWEHEARRRRPCSIEGCEKPQRAKGFCRRHYYLEHEKEARRRARESGRQYTL